MSSAAKARTSSLRGDGQSGDHDTPWLTSAQACLFGTVQSHSVFFAQITSTLVADGTSPLVSADGGFGMFQQADR